jgi:S-DNA-T family DNA segregation ATPase FtsK/SpoIIIE
LVGERAFAQHGIDGMGTYRRMKAAGRFAEDPFGDVFLLVDGWQTIRNDFEDMEAAITDLANRGLSYGVHVIGTASRWLDLRPAVRDTFGTRLELRLGDPSDSFLDRRTAMNVPEKAPGRGITPEKLQFLAGLPRADGRQEADDLSDGTAKLVSEVANAWTGPGAPPVRLLPATVPFDSLPPAGADTEQGIPIGIAEDDLRPVRVDFATDPHFLLFGDAECGKSGFLRVLAKNLMARRTPKEARIILIDYRRSLLGEIDSDHLIGYGTSAQVTNDIVAEVAGVMKSRLPGPDVTPEQLRSRSWWKGPDLYMLVDDYDLVAAGTQNPLSPLLDYLPQARDIGLHVVVTRRSGGASRALYEQFMMRLRELGSPGIVMSGEKDEGVLLGKVKPEQLPPGRGWMVNRRHGQRLVQLAWLPPSN